MKCCFRRLHESPVHYHCEGSHIQRELVKSGVGLAVLNVRIIIII